MTNHIKKFFRNTPLEGLILLMTAPVDGPEVRSSQKRSHKINREDDFKKYIFNNMIIGQKG